MLSTDSDSFIDNPKNVSSVININIFHLVFARSKIEEMNKESVNGME